MRVVARALLAIMYFYGIFHKINTDFLDPRVSCAVALYMPLADGFGLQNSLDRQVPGDLEHVHRRGHRHRLALLETLVRGRPAAGADVSFRHSDLRVLLVHGFLEPGAGALYPVRAARGQRAVLRQLCAIVPAAARALRHAGSGAAVRCRDRRGGDAGRGSFRVQPPGARRSFARVPVGLGADVGRVRRRDDAAAGGRRDQSSALAGHRRSASAFVAVRGARDIVHRLHGALSRAAHRGVDRHVQQPAHRGGRFESPGDHASRWLCFRIRARSP